MIGSETPPAPASKANAVYAARWNRQQERWEGLGPGSIGGRATDVYVDIDVQDRLYVAAYSPGGSYGGGATTRVWRWSGSSWTQLGEDRQDSLRQFACKHPHHMQTSPNQPPTTSG